MAGSITDELAKIRQRLSGTLNVTAAAPMSFTETQLTTLGVTTTRSFSGFSRLTAQYVIASINTNVVLRMEGSNDGVNWFNLNDANLDTIVTTNGVNALTWQGVAQNVRANFVSELGGTSATVDFVLRFG